LNPISADSPIAVVIFRRLPFPTPLWTLQRIRAGGPGVKSRSPVHSTPSTSTRSPSTEPSPMLCAAISISPPTVGIEDTLTICGDAHARHARTLSSG
jgi:hypothetical protein